MIIHVVETGVAHRNPRWNRHAERLTAVFPHDLYMKELVDEFVAELPSKVRRVEDAIAKEDMAKLEAAARQLKVEGASFGFEVISNAATDIETAIINKLPLQDMREDIGDLISLCLQVRSSAKSTPP